jgi:hypothetical protein
VRAQQHRLLKKLEAAQGRLAAMERTLNLRVGEHVAAQKAAPAPKERKERKYSSHNEEWAVSVPSLNRKQRVRRQRMNNARGPLGSDTISGVGGGGEAAQSPEERATRQQFADDNRLGLKSTIQRGARLLTESSKLEQQQPAAELKRSSAVAAAPPTWSMKMAPGAHSYSNGGQACCSCRLPESHEPVLLLRFGSGQRVRRLPDTCRGAERCGC